MLRRTNSNITPDFSVRQKKDYLKELKNGHL
jgi:hypothetical protein